LITWLSPAREDRQQPDEREPIPRRDWAIAFGIFILACLPGIWPALELLGDGDLRQAQIVARIQVFYRIQHHLDPMTFSRAGYTASGLMAIVWCLMRFRLEWGAAERWFAWFTGASIAIALIGVSLGYGERPIQSLDQITLRYRLLKFYPFRLADIMLPAAVSITVAGLAAQGLGDGLANLWGSASRARNRCWLLFSCFFIYSLFAPAVDRNPSRMPEAQLADWLDACRWIRENTPADALVWTPTNSWAFKWHAQRAEYVSRKDCPQDAQGIIEWNKRMGHQLGEAFQNEPRLTHAILRVGTMAIEPVYQNETYRIYDLSVFSRK
jgi:hypothetical protein